MQNTAPTAPQPFPLAQLAAMADKQNLACIAGTIKAIWPPKKGENSTGQWSIQNAVLVGSCGTEIGLWLKDREELPQSAKGKFVVMSARMGEKGLSGLYVMDDDFKAKITRKIKVTPTADIAYSEQGYGSQQAQQAPPQQAPPQQAPHSRLTDGTWREDPPTQSTTVPTTQPPSQQSALRKEPDAAQTLRDAQHTILQIANLHLMCARCVETYESVRFKAETGSDMTESQRQGAIASIFIESCRSGLVRSMPAKPL